MYWIPELLAALKKVTKQFVLGEGQSYSRNPPVSDVFAAVTCRRVRNKQRDPLRELHKRDALDAAAVPKGLPAAV